MGVITALRATPDGRGILVERDGAKWLRLPVHLVVDLALSKGEEMDAERMAAIEDAAALERLWEATLRYTVARGRSEREVMRRLRDRKATDAQAATVMARLAANGLADEADNARQRVERLAIKRWALRRIRGEMLQVGFSQDLVHKAMDDVLPADHDDRLLDEAVTRRGVPDSERDRRRMAERLMRHGFPPTAVRDVLRPDEGARDVGDLARARVDPAQVDTDAFIRQVRRRYPAQATDGAERRRALGWLARRGVRSDDARRILEAAATPGRYP